jgi:4-amino-4-deoxy-L-arabinose transferase-like glycosyltransferase
MTERQDGCDPGRRLLEWALIVGIILAGAALRLAFLDQIPPGLSHDEAYNGVTAIEVLLYGRRDIFFEIYNGIEPLIIYWEALYFHLFGITPYAMRLVNVTAGLLTIALTYALARRLFAGQGELANHRRWLPVLAALGVGLSFWAVFVSRLTLRAVTLPLFELPAVYCLWRGLTAADDRRPGWQWTYFALAGLWAGLAMYTYLSSRFVPLLLLAFLLYWLLRRQVSRRQAVGWALCFGVWALVFAPLAHFYVTHPDIFTRRADQVLTLPVALAGDPRPLLTSIGNTLGLFGILGPSSSRYGLAGRPIFEPVGASLFAIGLVTAVRRLWRPARQAAPYAVLVIWWLVMLIPACITSESPHYLRTIGALPPTYVLWALGLATVVGRLTTGRPPATGHTPAGCKWLVSVVATFYMAGVGGLTIKDYFVRWANDAEARTIYGAEFTEVAHYLASSERPGPVALSAAHFRDWDRFRLDVQMRHRPPYVVWFNGPQAMLFPPPDVRPVYIFTRSAPPHPRWLDYLELKEHGADMDVYGLRPAVRVNLSQPLDFTILEDQLAGSDEGPRPLLQLRGYELSGQPQAGERLSVLLHWQALLDVPGDPDYAFFLHLIDRHGYVWAQADANGYGAVDWQPGVEVLQWLHVSLPPDLPPLAYTLQLGLQERDSGRELLIASEDNAHSIVLRSLDIAPATTPPPPDFAVPNPCHVDASRPFTLRGYSLSQRIVQPGGSVHVALFWQTHAVPDADYRLSLWLVGEQGQIVDLTQRQPLDGDYPTHRWQAGQWVRDRFDVQFPSLLPPGLYTLVAAWQADDARPVELGTILVPAP